MYLFDFKSKLRKLNPALYVDSQRRASVVPGLWNGPLMFRGGTRKVKRGHGRYNYASAEQRRYLEDLQTGARDEELCRVSLNWMPEYDQFDLEKGLILQRGWRTVLNFLVKRKTVTLNQARKIFSRSDLGTSTWDHLEFTQRLTWARKEQ